MNWETLIAVSRLLADLQRFSLADPRSGPARLNRSVSTAYYAMFHALAQSNADVLAGESATQGSTRAWLRVYRALEHRMAYRELRENAMVDFSGGVKEFGDSFRELQRHRHIADYDPHSRFSQADALGLIHQAESAIIDLMAAPEGERRELAVRVLFPARE